MHENHQREQYFFDDATTAALADEVADVGRICCLCAPTLGRALVARGHTPRILDIDERFADVPGFRRYDLYRPEPLDEDFDLLVCDPPFFSVSLSQLFATVRLLCRFDTKRRVMIAYLVRREQAILGTFAPFGLTPTPFEPTYVTVQRCERNRIRFYANYPAFADA